MANSKIKKYLGDGLLIVFSVLFALFINKLAENSALENKKDIALDSIKKELQQNAKILTSWNKNHAVLNDRVQKIAAGENDSLRKKIGEGEFLNLNVMTGDEPLVQDLLSNTAWETAKSTGILSEFNFELTQKLTNAYSIQEELMSNSLRSIINLYFERETHNKDYLASTLNQFSLRLWNMVGQERGLIFLYDEALKELDKYEI